MSTTALYKALLEANVSEASAEKAAEGLISANEAATKADIAALRTDIAKMEVRLIKWNIATAIVVVGVIIAVVVSAGWL